MFHYRHRGSPFQVTLDSYTLTGVQMGFPKVYQGLGGDTIPILIMNLSFRLPALT